MKQNSNDQFQVVLRLNDFTKQFHGFAWASFDFYSCDTYDGYDWSRLIPKELEPLARLQVDFSIFLEDKTFTWKLSSKASHPDLSEMKAVIKTVESIKKKMEKLEETEGKPYTVGHATSQLMRCAGVLTAISKKDGRYYGMTSGQVSSHLQYKVNEFLKSLD